MLDLPVVHLFILIITLMKAASSSPIPSDNEKNNLTSRIIFDEPTKIFFPGETKKNTFTFPEIKFNEPPKCAKGSTFCEDYESYPYNELETLLKRKSVDPKTFFGEEEPTDELSNRLGHPEEQFVCASLVKTIYPQLGKTRMKEWKLIVNMRDEKGYIQGIKVETCHSENQRCELIGDLPFGYTVSCKQKYIYRKLYALSKNGLITLDSFQMPSACCCAYKRDGGFLKGFKPKKTEPAFVF